MLTNVTEHTPLVDLVFQVHVEAPGSKSSDNLILFSAMTPYRLTQFSRIISQMKIFLVLKSSLQLTAKMQINNK